MAEDMSTYTDGVRVYLAQQGGSVHDADGRGLGDEIARAIGVEKPAIVGPVLDQMERDGLITREMRGFRTYRIDLVAPASAAATPAAGTPAATAPSPPPATPAVGPTDTTPAAPPASPAGAPTANGAAPAEVLPVADDAPDVAPPTVSNRPISLRQALAQRVGDTTLSPEPEAPAPAETSGPAAAAAPAPASGDVLPADIAPSRARRTSRFARSAPTTVIETPVVEPEAIPADHRHRRLSRFARSAPTAVIEAPAVEPDTTPADEAQPARSRLHVAIPEVRRAPSTPIVFAVIGAMVVLVLIAVISVVVTRGPGHHTVVAFGSTGSSTDACQVVPSAAATAAFGDNAGAPNLVLGECVYDDGAGHELIVAIARQNAQAQFNSSRSSTATPVSAVGDRAYYDNGRLWVLKGSNLMLLTLTPFSATAPSPKLLALATSAAAGL